VPVILAFGLASMAQAQDTTAVTNAGALNPLSALDTASFKSFIEKPLFSPTRKLPEESVSADEMVADITPPALNIRLLGVVVAPRGSIARILDVDDGTSHSLRKGETFNDWAVMSIDKAVLRLSKGDEIADFTVFKEMVAKHPDAEDETNPTGHPAVTQTTRVVRVVKPWPGTDDALTARDSSRRHAQDLIDFFGSDAGKAE
jgi:hypothetical protein